MTAASREETTLRFMIHHLNDRIWKNFGCVDGLDDTRESNVGRGRGGQQWVSRWAHSRSYGCIQCILKYCIRSEKSAQIVFIVSHHGPDVTSTALFNFSFLPRTPATFTIHHSPAILYRRALHHCRAFPLPPIITTIFEFVVVVYTALSVDTPLLFAGNNQFLIPQSVNMISLDVSRG